MKVICLYIVIMILLIELRGISPNNKNITKYMKAARQFAIDYIDNQISNEILNWTGK
ncbi:hypothetical protein [Oceanirhabdus sp. W0125-5]|uniref:hypothetical protein n=1 Tax=Oceanirhabdus sp. W0125-5 TaxID=2999116 RepID=UPI0022F34300|nr:hypothetical protein [Oceanirhabdus sp. W0125-5]WBW97426.1 hypothetical protein OW730_00800 [Oceanirhabdus sp. W0125-5]